MTQSETVRTRISCSSRLAGGKANPGETVDVALSSLERLLIHYLVIFRSGHSLYTEPSGSNVSTVSSIEEREESEA